jgi:hypothetical protein
VNKLQSRELTRYIRKIYLPDSLKAKYFFNILSISPGKASPLVYDSIELRLVRKIVLPDRLQIDTSTSVFFRPGIKSDVK